VRKKEEQRKKKKWKKEAQEREGEGRAGGTEGGRKRHQGAIVQVEHEEPPKLSDRRRKGFDIFVIRQIQLFEFS